MVRRGHSLDLKGVMAVWIPFLNRTTAVNLFLLIVLNNNHGLHNGRGCSCADMASSFRLNLQGQNNAITTVIKNSWISFLPIENLQKWIRADSLIHLKLSRKTISFTSVHLIKSPISSLSIRPYWYIACYNSMHQPSKLKEWLQLVTFLVRKYKFFMNPEIFWDRLKAQEQKEIIRRWRFDS